MRPFTTQIVILLLACLLALLLGACAPAAPPPPSPDWQPLIEQALAADFPGYVLLVDRPQEAVWVGAGGFADLETQRAMTPDTPLHVGSVNKLMTAVAVLRLVDSGQLELDARVADLLAGDEAVERLPHLDSVTVAQLLDHSSGFAATNNDPAYIRALIGPEAGDNRSWTPRDFVRLAARREPEALPGEGHHYSDTNYVLLGLVVETVTGTSFERHLRDALFEPLGMSSTYFFAERPENPSASRGYLVMSDIIRSITQVPDRFRPVGGDLRDTTAAGETLPAAGGVVSTASDLHRLARAAFGGDFLEPASRSWLLAAAEGLEDAPVGTERQRTMRAYHRPSGVLVTSEGDGPGGTNALVAYHPATDTLVVGLTNVFGLWTESDLMLGQVDSILTGGDG